MELNKATVNIESTASVWDFLKYTALEGVETNIYFTFFQLQTHNTNQNTTTSASYRPINLYYHFSRYKKDATQYMYYIRKVYIDANFIPQYGEFAGLLIV